MKQLLPLTKLLAFALLLFLNIPSWAQIIFVNKNATGNNTGYSWANAYITLQSALDRASSTDTIWVAGGTYYPTEAPDGAPTIGSKKEMYKAFHATSKNIAIYGGFNGTETWLAARDLQNNPPTIFSGDLDSNDIVTGTGLGLNITQNAKNVYHVFVLSMVDQSTFDGVTITGGSASTESGDYLYNGQRMYNHSGGGIYALSYYDSDHSSSVTLNNSTLIGNSAARNGGAVASAIVSTNSSMSTPAISTSVKVLHSNIVQNFASDAGGIYTQADSATIVLNSSTVSGNSAKFGDGGGISALGSTAYSISTVTLLNSTISGNYASTFGGGVCTNAANSFLTITNSTIKENTASYGAGVNSGGNTSSIVITNSSIFYNNGGGVSSYASKSSIAILNSTFKQNTASKGGGLHVYGGTASVRITNSIFTENNADISGAGIYYSADSSSSLIIEGSSITKNYADGDGAGIYYNAGSHSDSTSLLRISKSTIQENYADDNGGGIFSNGSLYAQIIIDSSTIQQNYADPSSGYRGGALFCYSSFSTSITVSNSNMLNNFANLDGGAIAAYGSKSCIVTLTNDSITGNVADFSGGAIYTKSDSTASVIINKTTIDGNRGQNGAGVYSQGSTAIITCTHSTISNNRGQYGGGLRAHSVSGSNTSRSIITIVNSTITQNLGSNEGGGIYSSTFNNGKRSLSQVTVVNSTISGNTSAKGTGLSAHADSTLVKIQSSIIWSQANNISNYSDQKTLPIFSEGFNIFSNNPLGSNITDRINITSSQLRLQPLANNGGLNLTELPGAGSVAIDAGNPNDTTDAQNRPILKTRDVGAAEYGCQVILEESIDQCGSYTWRDSITYTSDTSGLIFVVVGATADGCDSVYILNLVIHHSPEIKITHKACYHYTWKDGITYTSDTNGLKYIVIGAATGGCDSVYVLDLTIYRQPEVSVYRINGTALRVVTSGSLIEWIDCATNFKVPGATNDTFVATANGHYAARITEPNCHFDSTSICFEIDQVVGLNELALSNLDIFPNPTKGEFSIEFSQIAKADLIIFDLNGKLLLSKSGIRSGDVFSVSEMAPGIYILQLKTETSIYTKRFVKE